MIPYIFHYLQRKINNFTTLCNSSKMSLSYNSTLTAYEAFLTFKRSPSWNSLMCLWFVIWPEVLTGRICVKFCRNRFYSFPNHHTCTAFIHLETQLLRTILNTELNLKQKFHQNRNIKSDKTFSFDNKESIIFNKQLLYSEQYCHLPLNRV